MDYYKDLALGAQPRSSPVRISAITNSMRYLGDEGVCGAADVHGQGWYWHRNQNILGVELWVLSTCTCYASFPSSPWLAVHLAMGYTTLRLPGHDPTVHLVHVGALSQCWIGTGVVHGRDVGSSVRCLLGG